MWRLIWRSLTGACLSIVMALDVRTRHGRARVSRLAFSGKCVPAIVNLHPSPIAFRFLIENSTLVITPFQDGVSTGAER